MMLWDLAITPELAHFPQTAAVVAADYASHMTSALSQTFASPQRQVARFPVTRPISEISRKNHSKVRDIVSGLSTGRNRPRRSVRRSTSRNQLRSVLAALRHSPISDATKDCCGQCLVWRR
jgi:hypothetical protein